jgi:lipid A 3-O-deacylase
MAKATADLIPETLIHAGVDALMAVGAAKARADEMFVGAFAHDVSAGISSHGVERGMDVNAGYRTALLGLLSAIDRPMLYGTYFGNTARRTSYGAIGFQWRRYMLGDRFYGQIGVGGALHDQPAAHPDPFGPGLTPAEMNERLHLQRNFKPLGSRLAERRPFRRRARARGPLAASRPKGLHGLHTALTIGEFLNFDIDHQL